MKKLIDSDGSVNPESLCVVHVTDYRPRRLSDNSLEIQTTSQANQYKIFRNTVHFSLNHEVQSHMEGNWSSCPYVVIGDMGSAIKANGSPTGFNPIDTWWDRDINEKMCLPDATLIAPGVLQDGLSVRRGNEVLYKAWNFTIGDLKQFNKEISETHRYVFEDLLEDQPALKNLLNRPDSNNDEKIMELLPYDDALRNKIANALKKISRNLAVVHTMEELGYPYQKAGKNYWVFKNSPLKPDALNEIAKTLNSDFTVHAGGPQSHFERCVNGYIAQSESAQPGSLELIELEQRIRRFCAEDMDGFEVSEKTKRVGKYVLNKLLVEMGCQPLENAPEPNGKIGQQGAGRAKY